MDALPPQVLEICDRSRAVYVDYLDEIISEWLPGATAIGKVLVEEDRAPAPKARLALPTRVDAVGRAKGRPDIPITLYADIRYQFTPVDFDFAGAKVEFEPFDWFHLVVDTDLPTGPLTDGIVADWYRVAYVARPSTDDPFKHGVHSVSDPQPVNGGVRFETDLGTARCDVLVDLLRQLGAAGATHIKLSDGSTASGSGE